MACLESESDLADVSGIHPRLLLSVSVKGPGELYCLSGRDSY